MPELHAKDGLEKRLENLSNILEKQLSVEESRQKEVKEEEKERQVVNPEGLGSLSRCFTERCWKMK